MLKGPFAPVLSPEPFQAARQKSAALAASLVTDAQASGTRSRATIAATRTVISQSRTMLAAAFYPFG